MFVPRTADGFRAVVRAMRSLNGSNGVRLKTFSLPADCCVGLLMKNLGKPMPDDVVREELETLDFRVQESCSSAPDVVTKNTSPPERPSAVSALPTLWPLAALLWICTPVCCLWQNSTLGEVLNLKAAASLLLLWKKPHSQLSGLL